MFHVLSSLLISALITVWPAVGLWSGWPVARECSECERWLSVRCNRHLCHRHVRLGSNRKQGSLHNFSSTRWAI